MEKLGHERNKVVKRGSAATGKRKRDDPVAGAGDREEVIALKKRIARLEAENRQLRKQIATLTDSMNRSSRSSSDSVREQQHNFFKYSNVRRY